MSLPKLPLLDPPITREEAINQIIASIAMEELALSHIINAEGEKLQYILGTSGPGATIDDVLKVNESVRAVLQRAAECQSALKNKLQNVLSSAVLTGPAGPAGPTGATGPAGLTRAAATIGVDPSVEHVPYAGQPYVVNIGTHYDAVLRFGIPGGMPGKPGATGATGPEGPPGATGPVGKPGNPIESYHFDLSEQNDIFNLALKNIIYRLEHVGDHFRLMLLPVSSYVPISIDFKCATIFETTVDYVVRDNITLSNTLEVSNAIYLASRETHKIWIRQKDSKENKWFTCVVYLFASGQTGERVDVWVEWINEDITYDKPMNLYNLRSKKDDFPEKLAGGH